MYFLFLDNSYIENPTQDIACLGGLIIEATEYKRLRSEFFALKQRYGLNPSDPVKWSPPNNQRFAPQRAIANQNTFKSEVLRLLGKSDLQILCAFINRDLQAYRRALQAHTITGQHFQRRVREYELQALEYLAQRFQMHMQDINRGRQNPEEGLILIEGIDGPRSSALVERYKTAWHDGSGIEKIRFEMLFDTLTYSHDFGSAAVQLADFVISSMCHAARTSDWRFIREYKPRVRRRYGRVKGYGLVIYPSNSIMIDALVQEVQSP